jgi:hypothetical protein
LHKSETESLFGFWETCLFLSRRLATLETDMLYELGVGAQKKAVRRNW